MSPRPIASLCRCLGFVLPGSKAEVEGSDFVLGGFLSGFKRDPQNPCEDPKKFSKSETSSGSSRFKSAFLFEKTYLSCSFPI